MGNTANVVRAYFQKRFAIELTKSEVEEVVQALYYLSKARIQFALLSKKKEGKV